MFIDVAMNVATLHLYVYPSTAIPRNSFYEEMVMGNMVLSFKLVVMKFQI